MSFLLGRANKLFLANDSFKRAVADALHVSLNLKIKDENVSLKNGVVFIKTSPIVKTEIFLHKQDIIDLINKNNPPNPIIDLK